MKNKQRITISIIGLLTIMLAAVMYKTGHDAKHLSELNALWLYPVPLGTICCIGLIFRWNER